MEELRREVAQLKVEISRLDTIVDELGYLVVNNIPAQEDAETLIRKIQNTLKILDVFLCRQVIWLLVLSRSLALSLSLSLSL